MDVRESGRMELTSQIAVCISHIRSSLLQLYEAFHMRSTQFIAPIVGLAASTLAIGTFWMSSAPAVQFSDGRIAFNSPPLMLNHSAIPSYTGARNATFRFSIAVPSNAGESLSYVEIIPFSGPEEIDFRLNNILAYEGAGMRRGAPISVIGSSLDRDRHSNTKAAAIGVLFDPPLEPGRTATIVLKSLRNPSFAGSFLFEVTAYPDPEVGVSHRMGYASFTIYSRGGCDGPRC